MEEKFNVEFATKLVAAIALISEGRSTKNELVVNDIKIKAYAVGSIIRVDIQEPK